MLQVWVSNQSSGTVQLNAPDFFILCDFIHIIINASRKTAPNLPFIYFIFKRAAMPTVPWQTKSVVLSFPLEGEHISCE